MILIHAKDPHPHSQREAVHREVWENARSQDLLAPLFDAPGEEEVRVGGLNDRIITVKELNFEIPGVKLPVLG